MIVMKYYKSFTISTPLFLKGKFLKTLEECKSFLSTVNLPKISNEHKEFCDKDVTLEDLEACLFNMSIGKSPGNDGLTVEFYKAFWSDLKSTLFESIKFS